MVNGKNNCRQREKIVDAGHNRMLIHSHEGLTRTQISNNLGRNKPSTQIGRALGVLLDQGLVFMAKRETGGRPEEVWFSSKYQTK